MASDHVNGNGTEEPMDTSVVATRSEHFESLLQAGLPQKVAEKLDEIFQAGKKIPSRSCLTASNRMMTLMNSLSE